MKMLLYHGSRIEVKEPNLNKSKEKVDFGKGFYLTADEEMAMKWASNKKNAVVNTYELDTSGLKVCHLKLDETWLNYVAKNRGLSRAMFNDSEFDIIIGPTADDKMFTTIKKYLDGYLTPEKTIEYLNIMNFSEQIVLKTQKAIESLTFIKSKTLEQSEKQKYFEISKQEKNEALAKIEEYVKKQIENNTQKTFIDLSEYEHEY